MTPKPDFCKNCPINHVTEGYVPPQITDSHELIVGEAAGEDEIEYGRPFVGGAGRWLSSLLKSVRQTKDQFNIINTIGCKPPANLYPLDSSWKHTSTADARAAVQYCRSHHLEPFIESKSWNKIMALGNWAMLATTGKTGITTWRGSPLPLIGHMDKPRVMPTLHPAFLMRGSNLFPVAAADFRKSLNLPPENYSLFATPEEFKAFPHKRFVFDFEWDEWGNVTLAGICGEPYKVLVCSFVEPYVSILSELFHNATDLYGHNIISADSQYFDRWGWNIKARMWDTMLMQHLIQPDYRHGLSFCASVFTNRVHWKGLGEDDVDNEDGVERVPRAQWKTWSRADAIPIKLGGYGGCESDAEAFRLYNARDNASNYDIINPIEHLLDRYDLKKVYWNISRPVAEICRSMGEKGLRIDQERLTQMTYEIDRDMDRLQLELPDGLRPFEMEVTKRVPVTEETFKPAKRICKGTKKAKTSHEPVEVWFEQPNTTKECPTCKAVISSPKLASIKTMAVQAKVRVDPWNSTDQVIEYAKTQGLRLVYNIKTKQLTADKTARKAWGKHENAFVTIDKLKKLSTLRASFTKEALRSVDRMYYNLLVHGTSEGRLAARGARRGIDLNPQQCPKKARKIFVPDTPNDAFLSFDVKQGENIITTWIAKDWERWERILDPKYDEHTDLAQQIFKCDCTKDGPNDALRQVGKKVNHLKNYGGTAKKIHEILVADGYNTFTLADCREFDQAWRVLNKGTALWQDQTMELARVQGYLRNSFGRIRWFNTADLATKALAFLPASTLADCVLRMMIALHNTKYAQEIMDLGLTRAGDLPTGWDLRIQIHDDLTSHGPVETMPEAARLIYHVMTQPWKELDGLVLGVDAKYSTTSWGELENLPLSMKEFIV